MVRDFPILDCGMDISNTILLKMGVCRFRSQILMYFPIIIV